MRVFRVVVMLRQPARNGHRTGNEPQVGIFDIKSAQVVDIQTIKLKTKDEVH